MGLIYVLKFNEDLIFGVGFFFIWSYVFFLLNIIINDFVLKRMYIMILKMNEIKGI